MPSFTQSQNQAINDRGKDILVSASAGSGKTTVLVQRVLNEILSGTSVDQLLIVTFTKAAAEEMKLRIKSRLTDAINKNSENKNFLRQQLTKVDTANISTIDSFCMDVIHRFYYVINLDPSFSVLTDETQAALLKERSLKDIETSFLENEDQDFIDFYDNFAGDRNVDDARNLLLNLYNFSMAKPDYNNWLNSLPEKYVLDNNHLTASSFWQNEFKSYLLANSLDLLNKIENVLGSNYMEMKELENVANSFTDFYNNLRHFINLLSSDASYDSIREGLKNCLFTGSPRRSKKWDEDLLEFYNLTQGVKDSAKKTISEMYSSFFAVPEKEQIETLSKAQKITKTIVKVEKALINRFSELKREENLIDYSDMEQFAYKILHSDTSNSSLARSFYQNKFSEILIDEYQDINPLQQKILETMKSDSNNLFMVGDVKQSIYGFRQAEPTLFLEKYHQFGNQDDDSNERIVLADNFRSTKPVTELVNKLFNPIMDQNFGGIDYQNEAQLSFGASYYPEELGQASEFIYHKKTTNSEEIKDINFSEIQMVIERIKQLKKEKFQVFDTKVGKKRPIEYSDIVILTRSRSDNLEIMQEFTKNDIPLFISDAQNYFQTFELTIMMNYLKIIDNPDQDIPLVTVLRSPIFSFKEEDFAQIRIHSKNVSFYEALLNYVSIGNNLSERIKNFINQLEEMRTFASTHRISELIWSIYETTNLLEIMTSLPNGEQRRINLEALYERANSYESAGFKGLYQFINFINRMRQTKKDLAQPLLTKEAGNAVRLMTIHGSKGLEFPIVFCLGMQRQYQMRDLSGNYIITKESLGLTIRSDNYIIDSLVKSIANVEKRKELLEEESRILYVALTRARQKLILIGDIKNFDKSLQSWQDQVTENGKLLLSDRLNAKNSLSLIGPTLFSQEHLNYQIKDISNSLDQTQDMIYVDYTEQTINQNKDHTQVNPEQTEYGLLNSTTEKLFTFDYPFTDATKTTAYQAVSEIKRAFNDPLDPDLENSHLISSNNRYLQPIDTKPNFLFKNKYTGAEIGTATHLILQYYDYRLNNADQVTNEIERLVNENKLNPDIVSSIKTDQIDWFVHTDLANKFRDSPDKLYREVDFSSLILAKTLFKDFSDPTAKILVHGTIDGYFIDKDDIILFDYKTDHIDQSNLDESINKIKQKYTGQLRLYEKALNQIGQQKVVKKFLILLDAKQIVEVN